MLSQRYNIAQLKMFAFAFPRPFLIYLEFCYQIYIGCADRLRSTPDSQALHKIGRR